MDIVDTTLPSLNPASATYLKAKKKNEKRKLYKRGITVCVIIAIVVITYIFFNLVIEIVNPPSHLISNIL